MKILFLLICALSALTCSASFAQTQNGWTISYIQSDKYTYTNGSVYADYGIAAEYAYSQVALWGATNGTARAWILATMTLEKGQNASNTISVKPKSYISGGLSSYSTAAVTTTVQGDYFDTNTYTLSSQGNYNATLYGTVRTRDVNSAYDFLCDSYIAGSGYGSGYSEGRYIFQ